MHQAQEGKSYVLSPGVNVSTHLAVFCLFFLRWHDIANMSHNKSFFALELASKEETIQFQTVSEHQESLGMFFLKVNKLAFLCICFGGGGDIKIIIFYSLIKRKIL